MIIHMKPEAPPVVGEDGELVKPDTSVNPDNYANFVATNVHHDPLLFRIREHVSYYGCAYLCLAPVILLILIALFSGMSIFPILAIFGCLAVFVATATSPKNGGTK